MSYTYFSGLGDPQWALEFRHPDADVRWAVVDSANVTVTLQDSTDVLRGSARITVAGVRVGADRILDGLTE
ncbi:hypothetical protein [Rhodococcus koreensis]|uniref:Uncharacterized protein n=1 Tax=Rhodococcus koreensis TaxID=99653 RepID=A0A1H4S367_9NOCA|nr:hypothetical protein SAMN04490239_3895 [Rhodococcus koreensis]